MSPQYDKPKRFVPASLYPYGGFGDPTIEKPYHRVPRGTDRDSALQAVVQERLARRVRQVLEQVGMSEAELEKQLDYRKYGLVRKLNGNEQLTMRDVARLSTFFGGDVFTVMSTASESQSSGLKSESDVVAESVPAYDKGKKDSAVVAVRDLIADASARLREAGFMLRSSKDSGTAEALGHLAKAVVALGSNITSNK